MTTPYRKCVAIFLIKDSKVFVAQRIDAKDAWQAPQGGVDPGEKLLDAAKRELFEETNVSMVEFIASSSSTYRYDFPKNVKRRDKYKYVGQEMTFFVFKFLGDESEINLAKENQEFIAWKWVSTKELLDKIVCFKKPAYEQAVAEFRKLEILE